MLDDLKPYLTGTWGEWTFASFLDPTDGTSFTSVTSESQAEWHFRRNQKRNKKKHK
jgi:hypothetical protein